MCACRAVGRSELVGAAIVEVTVVDLCNPYGWRGFCNILAHTDRGANPCPVRTSCLYLCGCLLCVCVVLFSVIVSLTACLCVLLTVVVCSAWTSRDDTALLGVSAFLARLAIDLLDGQREEACNMSVCVVFHVFVVLLVFLCLSFCLFACGA